MRLFISIEIPDDLKQKIFKIQKDLDALGERLKMVEPENLHFCLKFLGEADGDKVSAKLEEILDGHKAFEIDIHNMVVFPNMNYIQVIALGAHSAGMKDVVRDIEDGMNEIGFEKEERKFIPHLTLARLKNVTDKRGIQDFIRKNHDVNIGKFVANEIKLIASELTPNGPKYTILKEFSLI